jgi:3-hydroxyisobutyrate dehydrogenase
MSDLPGAPARIGFIGLGHMGVPMARRVRLKQHALAVWNRDPDKARTLVEDGAMLCASPAEVLLASDIVGLCVTDHHAVEDICFRRDGLASVGRHAAGKVICDFSSIDPEVCVDLTRRMTAATGAGFVDSPVLGGVPAAEAGTLIIFAGGEAADIAKARPLLDAVSKRVTHMGPSGTGQATKVCNQMIVSVNMLVLAETFATARHAGIDVTRLTGALEGGFADSRPLQIFGPRMAARSHAPKQSSIAIMAKDIGLGQKMARQAGVATPLSALAAALYQAIRVRKDVDFNGDISELVELYETEGKT